MAAASLPPKWSVAGVTGPNSDSTPVRLSTDSGGILYDMAVFPTHLTPSPLIGPYTKERTINVADRFNAAGDFIRNSCATASGCNSYFEKLGRGVTLAGLLEWNVVFFLWLAQRRTAPAPTGTSVAVVAGEVEYTNEETRFARIVIGETSLRSTMVLAATIVHELAHVAGAPGATAEARDRALRDKRSEAYKNLIKAEGALKACKLGAQFDPNAIGALPGEFGTQRLA